MRKTVSLVLAICGTLLLLLLFATGRLIYTHVYSQDFSDIAETGPQSTITLTESGSITFTPEKTTDGELRSIYSVYFYKGDEFVAGVDMSAVIAE